MASFRVICEKWIYSVHKWKQAGKEKDGVPRVETGRAGTVAEISEASLHGEEV